MSRAHLESPCLEHSGPRPLLCDRTYASLGMAVNAEVGRRRSYWVVLDANVFGIEARAFVALYAVGSAFSHVARLAMASLAIDVTMCACGDGELGFRVFG